MRQAALPEGLSLALRDCELKHIVRGICGHCIAHFGEIKTYLDQDAFVVTVRLEVHAPHIGIAKLERQRVCALARCQA
eukprot:scaffold9689_cov116-Isochrysis_galbana.AAC.8